MSNAALANASRSNRATSRLQRPQDTKHIMLGYLQKRGTHKGGQSGGGVAAQVAKWRASTLQGPIAGIASPISESVKCRFSKCRFSVLNLKFDFVSDGGCTREKQIRKALGSLPPCGNRCRFSESAICSSRVHPPSEIKSNFKFKALRWRPLRWRLTLSDFQARL